MKQIDPKIKGKVEKQSQKNTRGKPIGGAILTDQDMMKQIVAKQIPTMEPKNITTESRSTFAEFPKDAYQVY